MQTTRYGVRQYISLKKTSSSQTVGEVYGSMRGDFARQKKFVLKFYHILECGKIISKAGTLRFCL
jgi:hypothetical protein